MLYAFYQGMENMGAGPCTFAVFFGGLMSETAVKPEGWEGDGVTWALSAEPEEIEVCVFFRPEMCVLKLYRFSKKNPIYKN